VVVTKRVSAALWDAVGKKQCQKISLDVFFLCVLQLEAFVRLFLLFSGLGKEHEAKWSLCCKKTVQDEVIQIVEEFH